MLVCKVHLLCFSRFIVAKLYHVPVLWPESYRCSSLVFALRLCAVHSRGFYDKPVNVEIIQIVRRYVLVFMPFRYFLRTVTLLTQFFAVNARSSNFETNGIDSSDKAFSASIACLTIFLQCIRLYSSRMQYSNGVNVLPIQYRKQILSFCDQPIHHTFSIDQHPPNKELSNGNPQREQHLFRSSWENFNNQLYVHILFITICLSCS